MRRDRLPEGLSSRIDCHSAVPPRRARSNGSGFEADCGTRMTAPPTIRRQTRYTIVFTA
jgi:hypothetical protein